MTPDSLGYSRDDKRLVTLPDCHPYRKSGSERGLKLVLVRRVTYTLAVLLLKCLALNLIHWT
jgi:hypothetical protein